MPDRGCGPLSHSFQEQSMNRDPILFRVDGTTRAGWERLNRCLVYAAALQRRRRPAYFLSQLDPAHQALTIKRGGNEWLEADDPAGSADDLRETVQEIRRLRPAAVIVDAAQTSESYLSELVASGSLIVSIDHLARARFPSQLVVNPLLDPSREAFDFHPGTQLLLGRRYALVRPEVRRVRQMRSQEPPPPFRALVALSDEDTQGLTLELVQRLLQTSRLERIDLAMRPNSPALARLRQLVIAHPTRLDLATEPAELTARIPRCHVAITRGDGWSLELACVGVPQLVIVQSEGHWPTARRLEDEGVAICLGDWDRLTPSSLRQALQDLLTDPLERQAMARCGRKLIDGRGPDRLVTALEILLHPSRSIDFQEAA
jgi:spore coat polysaccharide biosynthesis predicted glycosyltransferase SpsG